MPSLLLHVRERTHGPLERALASPEFADQAAEGRRLTLDEAVTAALSEARRVARPRGYA